LETAPARNPAITEEALRRLEDLVTQLKRLGFRVNLVAVVDRVPHIRVQNPHPGAGALQESVYAAPRGGGWCFWWSWAEPVIPGDDPAEAAAMIVRVLRARDD